MPTSITLIKKFRSMIGDDDSTSEIWDDDQIGEWIEAGYGEYTFGQRDSSTADDDDHTQAQKLARSYALYELAGNVALFFRWKDQNKEVDRSMTPENCRRIGKDLHDQVMAHRKAKKEGEGEAGQKAEGGQMQFDPGTAQADRTEGRGWY